MAQSNQDLRTLFQRHLEQETAKLPSRDAEHRAAVASCLRKFAKRGERSLRQLDQRKIQTLGGLVEVLPNLPRKLKDFGISLLGDLKAKQAVPVLVRMLSDDTDGRWSCGRALNAIGGRRVEKSLVEIAHRELNSAVPNRFVLEAVIHGLKYSCGDAGEDMLVTIFERTDLAGWLRGDAGDAIQVRDRRTRLFQRTWVAALRGLSETDIDVQFWSMFAIAGLASINRVGQRIHNERFHAALPKLREIAAHDHRLAPGYWWPMSAEAEDTIACIETGTGLDPEAAERWIGNKERGPWIRD